MATKARRRLINDYKKIQEDPPPGVTAAPFSENIMQWLAVIYGADDTIWEGAIFKLDITFSEEYPNKPPHIKFKTKVFHPNGFQQFCISLDFKVYTNGEICLDILQNQWSPLYDITTVLIQIQSLLCDPNPNSPANNEAAKLYTNNREEYDKRVFENVEQTWKVQTGEF